MSVTKPKEFRDLAAIFDRHIENEIVSEDGRGNWSKDLPSATPLGSSTHSPR